MPLSSYVEETNKIKRIETQTLIYCKTFPMSRFKKYLILKQMKAIYGCRDTLTKYAVRAQLKSLDCVIEMLHECSEFALLWT